MKIRVLFTLDYEIHGTGRGAPRKLMLEPTTRLMAQFARYGARLTVMADVAEILRFRRHYEETGRDVFCYQAIAEQLRTAVRTGHDVQLHLHPSYYGSRFVDGHLEQDYREYDLARLPPPRLDQIVGEGKRWLEELLRPVDDRYRCIAFRAANWSMNPAAGIVEALLNHGISIDTSVFKYGARNGMVSFDYGHAHSDLVPWPVSRDDVCKRDPQGSLYEFPIYTERRRLWHFLTATRLYRAALGKLNALPRSEEFGPLPADAAAAAPGSVVARLARLRDVVWRPHAWKLDFNQCSGRQLIAAARRVAERHAGADGDLPLVLIGHSKIFTRVNERSLEPFLRFVAAHHDTFAFGTFGEFDLRRFAGPGA